MRFGFSLSILWLTAFVLLPCTSCSDSQPSGVQDSRLMQTSTGSSPTPDAGNDRFSILHAPDEPIAVLNIRLTDPGVAAQSDLVLEIQNVSKRSVRQVDYGIWPSAMCGDYMYATPPSSPKISYREASLPPYGKAIIKVLSDKSLRTLLDPRTYESCPADHRKPQLMIQSVEFEDGEVWLPNQRTRPQQ